MFEESKVLGIVIDCSLKHVDGARAIDSVKKQLIQFVQKYDNGENLFYLYNPNLTEILNQRGLFISVVGNYETDGVEFNLSDPLKQTFFIIEKHYGIKKLVLITDRLGESNLYSVQKIKNIIARYNPEVEFIVIGLGQNVSEQANPIMVKVDELCKTLQEVV